MDQLAVDFLLSSMAPDEGKYAGLLLPSCTDSSQVKGRESEADGPDVQQLTAAGGGWWTEQRRADGGMRYLF